MAAVTVAWDAAAYGRLTNADTVTGFTAVGSGASPTVETDYYYQGAACISIQVKTSQYELYYTSASTSMSANSKVWLAKVIQTNKNAIDGAGLLLRIGSGTGAYYEYSIYNSNTYPTLGGFAIIPVNPNIAQWRSSTTGSPNLAATTYFSLLSDSAFTAKAPNLGMDAVDIMDSGTGLTLTRGDGADANGSFSDFVSTDEANTSNRWGIVQTRDGIIYVNGKLKIGNSSVNTEFTDSNRVIVFPDHRVSNNFCGVDFNLSNTGDVYAISSCTFNGRGALYTSDDTRPFYTVTGTAGTLNLDSCTFNTFGVISFTSSCTVNGGSFLNGLSIVQNSANLYGITVQSPTNGQNVGFITSDNPTKLDNLSISMGSFGGHALTLTTPGSYTLTGHSYTGYSTSNGQSNSTIYNNSGGSVTLNVVGGDVPTVRNGTSATTTITASVNVTLTGLQDNTEVRVFNQGTTTVVDGTENATAGTTGNRSFTFSTSASTALDIRIINKQYEYLFIQYTTTGDASQSIPVQQRFDRNYRNPNGET